MATAAQTKAPATRHARAALEAFDIVAKGQAIKVTVEP
jgi:hypothetical protein